MGDETGLCSYSNASDVVDDVINDVMSDLSQGRGSVFHHKM